MTTEYYLQEGDTHESLARDLLQQAESPDQVHWSPRPDVYGGGVYLLADHGIAERTRAARQASRDEQAQAIADSEAAALARDEHPDVASGLATPAEAGFSANTGTDPGAADEDDDETTDEEADAEADADEAEEESKLTPAQKRAAAKKAKQEAAAVEASADEEKSE